MAQGDRILYAPNLYLDDIISSEASTRIGADNSIQSNINSTKSILAGTQTTVAGLSASISGENSLMLAQVGGMNFGGLTWDDNGTPRNPETLTKAINALNALSLVNNAALSTAGGDDLVVALAKTSVSELDSNYASAKINAILALSDADKNGFTELINIINNNDLDVAAAISTAQVDLNNAINAKTTKYQDVNTTMYYVDKTTSIQYKLAVSNGNVVLIEI